MQTSTASPAASINNEPLIRVCELSELEAKGHVVVRGADRPIVVFHNDGDVCAVDNRCPHMGFPLAKGTCRDGRITCHWHHARFDAHSGSTFDLFADDVPAYDVTLRDGAVFVSPHPRQRDPIRHGYQRLEQGMARDIALVSAKAILALRSAGVLPTDIVRRAALFGTAHRDGWAMGMTVLTALANVMPELEEETAYLALYQGVRRVASDCAGQAPRQVNEPLDTDDLSLETLGRWLNEWTTVRQRDAAERTVLTAAAGGSGKAGGADLTQLSRLLFTAAVQRYYADGGHLLDFTNKAFELLEAIGPEHAAHVLPTLMAQLTGARGGEELDAWRHPIDLVELVRDAQTHLTNQWAVDKGKTWAGETELAHAILGDAPGAILNAITNAAGQGARLEQLTQALAYAAALRIARFGASNEIGDWITALHSFSYCNALDHAVRRCPDPALAPGILHGAMSVYLNRFLNVPPARLPGERDGLDDLPTHADELCRMFLQALDRQQQIDQAARIVARYLQQDHPVKPLLNVLVMAAVREDANFHTIQMVEAAIAQFHRWGPGEQGGHILIAAARYLAAHSPTPRTGLQTARIALRLHKGESLHEDDAK